VETANVGGYHQSLLGTQASERGREGGRGGGGN